MELGKLLLHNATHYHTKTETDNSSYRPPPTTVVNLGDEIHLTVINNLDVETSTTLHAHGFHQLNNNPYDGPEGITQWLVCLLLLLSLTNETQWYQISAIISVSSGIIVFRAELTISRYIWHADKEGTFWIHSHHVG
jgi:hypothetical protein